MTERQDLGEHSQEKNPLEKPHNEFSSANYWEQRYKRGGNSGAGSHTHLMEFKSSVLNEFIENAKIGSVVDFGVGDGSQLVGLRVKQYIGFDVSQTILLYLKETFSSDPSKHFFHVSEYTQQRAELAMSLDVIFHLIEDSVFHEYMSRLFDSATKYVIIYSSNRENYYREAPHVKHRKFSRWVRQYRKEWKCVQFIKNKYPMRDQHDDQISRTFSNFYVFERITLQYDL